MGKLLLAWYFGNALAPRTTGRAELISRIGNHAVNQGEDYSHDHRKSHFIFSTLITTLTLKLKGVFKTHALTWEVVAMAPMGASVKQ